MATRPSVLITGSARRIGAAMAQCFAAAGWHVVIHHRGAEASAEALAARLPSAETIGADLAERDAPEALIAGLCMRHDLLPATLGLERPDPEIPIAPTRRNRAARLDRVMSNSFGFGGINVSLVLGRSRR